jgi:hypothetical protein
MEQPRARGRCVCGAVSFRVAGPLRDVINCHCARCRRFTGHHMAATLAEVGDVEIDDVEGQLTWFEPVDEAAYAFCGRCGSSLFWQGVSTPDRISICAGTLEPPTGLSTAEAWWVAEASDYHQRPDLPERDRE